MSDVLRFSKMQGAGNDFVVVDARRLRRDWPALARRLCGRRLGIGADGLILVCHAHDADLRMRMFNPDGSEAETCGNGLRCFTKFAIERGLVRSRRLTIRTGAGVSEARADGLRGGVDRVRVSMAVPRFEAEVIPASLSRAGEEARHAPVLDYPLVIGNVHLALALVSMGNPHAVHFAQSPVSSFPLGEVGPVVESHPMFPQRTNLEVARVLDSGHVEARVWERGVGETLACGSGACAIAVAAQLRGYCGEHVDIMLPGGTLTVDWRQGGPAYLSGPVAEVFTGEILI